MLSGFGVPWRSGFGTAGRLSRYWRLFPDRILRDDDRYDNGLVAVLDRNFGFSDADARDATLARFHGDGRPVRSVRGSRGAGHVDLRLVRENSPDEKRHILLIAQSDRLPFGLYFPGFVGPLDVDFDVVGVDRVAGCRGASHPRGL